MEERVLIADFNDRNVSEKYNLENIFSEVDKYINNSKYGNGGLVFLRTGKEEENLEDIIGTITGIEIENNKVYAVISFIEDSVAYKIIKPIIWNYGIDIVQATVKGYWEHNWSLYEPSVTLKGIQSMGLTINKAYDSFVEMGKS